MADEDDPKTPEENPAAEPAAEFDEHRALTKNETDRQITLTTTCDSHPLLISVQARNIAAVGTHLEALTGNNTYILEWASKPNYIKWVGEDDDLSNVALTRAIHEAVKLDEPDILSKLFEAAKHEDIAASITQLFELTNYLPEHSTGDGKRRSDVFNLLLEFPDLEKYLEKTTAQEIIAALAGEPDRYANELAQLRAFVGVGADVNYDLQLPSLVWPTPQRVQDSGHVGDIEEVRKILGNCSDGAKKDALAMLVKNKASYDSISEGAYEGRVAELMAMVELLDGSFEGGLSNEEILLSLKYGEPAVFEYLYDNAGIADDPARQSTLFVQLCDSDADRELKQSVMDKTTTISSEAAVGALRNAIKNGDEEFFGTREEGLIRTIISLEHEAVVLGTGEIKAGSNDDIPYAAATIKHQSGDSREQIKTSIGMLYRLASAGADITREDASGRDPVSILRDRITKVDRTLETDHRFEKLEFFHKSKMEEKMEAAKVMGRAKGMAQALPLLAEAQAGAIAMLTEQGVDPNVAAQMVAGSASGGGQPLAIGMSSAPPTEEEQPTPPDEVKRDGEPKTVEAEIVDPKHEKT